MKKYAQKMALPLVVLLSISALHNCGWRLRGLGMDASTLPAARLRGEDGRFLGALARELSLQGLQISEDDTARWTILVKNHAFSRRLAAVNQAGQANSFLLGLTIRFVLSNSASQGENTAQSVSASRDLQYDQTAVLAKEEEEKTLRQALLRDTAQQLIYRYRAGVKR